MYEDDFDDMISEYNTRDITLESTKKIVVDNLRLLVDRLEMNIRTGQSSDESFCIKNIVKISNDYNTLIEDGHLLDSDEMKKVLEYLFDGNKLYDYDELRRDLEKKNKNNNTLGVDTTDFSGMF